MTQRTAGTHAVAFIFVTMLIDTIGFGIIMPVMPQLIMEMTGKPIAEATLIGGALLTTFAVMQFAFGPVMGNLSDAYGRRPVLLASMAAFAFDYLLMGFAPTLALLFVGRAIAGVAGALYSPAMAYLADVSEPEKRAQAFGMMGAAFGLGFVLGPALGGLLGEYGVRAPFFAAAALAAVNFIYGTFALPESLPKERRRPFDLKRANPLGTLVSLKRYPAVMAIAGAVFLWQLAHMIYPSTWAFYAEIRFDWSPSMIGASLAGVGVTMALVQGLLTGRIVRKLGEYRTAMLGMSGGALAMVGYGLATQTWMPFAIMFTVGMLQGLAYPAMNAIMSKQVPPDSQGELQGGVAAMMSLTSIFGPLLFSQVLGRFSAPGAPVHFPGAAFILAAAMACLALLIFLRAARGSVSPANALPGEGAAS